MGLFKTIFILIITFISVVHTEVITKNANNYGPYSIAIEHFRACRGPKSKNLTIMTTEMKQDLIGVVNLTFLVDARIEEIKVQVHSIKDNKKTFLYNQKLNNPCKHYAVAAMINKYLNTKDCNVKKGNYTTEINFREVVYSFLGTSFFYGTYNYKAELTSKMGNIACFNCTQTFKKKIRV